MKDRESRHRAIERIIRSSRVESQEALSQQLGRSGFSVTQATLSRDLNHLMVAKISDGAGGYYYTIAGEGQARESDQTYRQDLLRGWISVDFSHNIGVVKTLAGHADSVAIALDNLGLVALLGTVAGDDTIVVILKEGSRREDFLAQLATRIPQLQDELGRLDLVPGERSEA